MKNRELILLMLWAACGTTAVFSAEPDEGGIGGTGHSDSVLTPPLFDRPELPERVETPERVEVPSFPDSSAPAGEIVTVPAPPTTVENPAPSR